MELNLSGVDDLIYSPSPLTRALHIWDEELTNLLHYAQKTGELPFGIGSLSALQVEIDWVLEGLRNGFEIIDKIDGVRREVPPYHVSNYPSIFEHTQEITENINKEVEQGILIKSTRKPRWLTALNIKLETEKVRILRDYSAPHGRAINEFTWISDIMHIMSLDHAIEFMHPNYFLAKMDISNAFREVPIHNSGWENLSFEWQGVFYMDTRLPFGLRNAPEIFTRITNLIRAMLSTKGIKATVVYVDDFLIVAQTIEACTQAWLMLKELLTKLGFTVNMKVHKSVPPTKCLTFLGIILDTDVNQDASGIMQARVAQDKLDLILSEAKAVANCSMIRRKNLESLVGKLNFISKVVYGSRPYLRRMIDCLYKSKDRLIPITKGLQLDVAFWIEFAQEFNGKAIIIENPIIPPHYLSVDAATDGIKGQGGIGGFFNGEYFGVPIAKLAQKGDAEHKKAKSRKLYPTPTNEQTMHINYLELFAIWWAIVKWGPSWAGYHIIIHTDNEAARFMLNKGTARAPIFMPLLRDITKRMAKGGFRVQGVRVSTEANVLADPLSRGDWTKFYQELDHWKLETRDPSMHCLPRPITGTSDSNLKKF